ncbi:peptidoglycan-binding protein [Kitasatospora sp. NPDC017646]|uniref:peptidoglycan-binding protein n=1 Tax=Kitasatospora sp. NPDC017646 TaxID=3364024 RepID=UPI0037B00A74
MRNRLAPNRLAGGLITAGIVLAAGIVTAPAASAQTSQYCGYTSSEPTLSYGSSGNAVKQLQCELNHVVYSPDASAPLDVDGVWGDATDAAVAKFQRCTGLYQDTVVGPQTWSKLDQWVVTRGWIGC